MPKLTKPQIKALASGIKRPKYRAKEHRDVRQEIKEYNKKNLKYLQHEKH